MESIRFLNYSFIITTIPILMIFRNRIQLHISKIDSVNWYKKKPFLIWRFEADFLLEVNINK